MRTRLQRLMGLYDIPPVHVRWITRLSGYVTEIAVAVVLGLIAVALLRASGLL